MKSGPRVPTAHLWTMKTRVSLLKELVGGMQFIGQLECCRFMIFVFKYGSSYNISYYLKSM